MRDTSDYPILNAAVEGVGTRQPKEERFLSPGTWTRPSTVNWVQVIVVGGGGGGAVAPAPPTVFTAQNGGGGGVRIGLVPVSAPVPITVGAGGTGDTWPTGAPATAGGSSAFGPLTPPVPANTFSVGGGGAGIVGPRIPVPLAPTTTNGAPADGGGPGGLIGDVSAAQQSTRNRAGRWGTSRTANTPPGSSLSTSFGGSALGSIGITNQNNSAGIAEAIVRPSGRFGFGGGGGSARHGGGISSPPATATNRNGRANSGGGAAGTPGAAPTGQQPGGTGGSGIVIVRYWE